MIIKRNLVYPQLFIIYFLGILASSCTKKDLPEISTSEVTTITQFTAKCGGNITSEGGSTILAKGVCWSTNPSTTINDNKTNDGAGATSFSSSLSNLKAGTVYYVRAYATNSEGTGYAMTISFTSLPPTLPVLTSSGISMVTQNSAICGGNITSDGGSIITARGVCWSTVSNPKITDSKTTDGSGIGTFTSSIISLTTNTTYFLRAYATNSTGTSYGNEIIFTTRLGTITDVDGNIYNTISIGNQIWTVENLKTTKYNDGTGIPLVSSESSWLNLPSPAFCWYDNNPVNYKDIYGALYNWHAVNTGKLCPTGWHVPSDIEWTTLTSYLGGTNIAGGKMKETGTNHWIPPNVGATNESGFTALPAGQRYADGVFQYIGYGSYWWSSTAENVSNAYPRRINQAAPNVYADVSLRSNGHSIRCIKD